MRKRGTHRALINLKADREAVRRQVRDENSQGDERGMALIAVLLILSLMLMLGLAVTFTSLSDKAITQNFKNLTSGFYAAEAGVNNLHRLLRNDKFIIGSLPDPPRVTQGQPTLSPNDFIIAAEAAMNKKEVFPNNAAYNTKIKIKDIQVPYPAD